MDSNPKIGFVGWNPFQLIHVRSIIKRMDNAYFILANRRESLLEFDDSLMNDPRVPVRILKKGNILSLDGEFDVLVFQTPIANIDAYEKTRIAMLQYGYAKEPYNYAPWRAFADLNLTYGSYAENKIKHLSPTEATGNPRYDDWLDANFHIKSKEKYGSILDPKRKTVLYAPTWGELSSFDKFIEAVFKLGENFNVLLKMHHNTDLKEYDRKKTISHTHTHILGANDDLLELLAITDVILSDYSGAIFDAIYCRKPVILLNTDISKLTDNKLDEYSLEYSQRDQLGVQVDSPEQLSITTLEVANAAESVVTKAEAIRTALFVTDGNSTERVISALKALADGQYQRTQQQKYINREMKDYYSLKRELTKAKKELKRKRKLMSFFGIFRR